ncbi:unnamed protein product [Echinostoma caproni]|uniref:Nudix hydrolase domain-containing protein n=1 Tax=Echinostoma caproni TaxID=27848 RepID=A0A183AYR0_9TREM|nr:unnamed protein product [Echinostoma caproni]
MVLHTDLQQDTVVHSVPNKLGFQWGLLLNDSFPFPPVFDQSIVSIGRFERISQEFGPDGIYEALLSVKQTGDRVAVDSGDTDALPVPIRRPAYCPFAARNQTLRSHIPPAQLPSGRVHIPVASACLLESPRKDALLLTQRPWHMRTYPGLWVPPGGHSEPGESIAVNVIPGIAGIMELFDSFCR